MRQLDLGALVERPVQAIAERQIWWWRASARGLWFPCVLEPFEGGSGPDAMAFYSWFGDSPEPLQRLLKRCPGGEWRRGEWPK